MGDFSSSRIEGITERDSESEPGDRQPRKRKPQPEEKSRPEMPENEDLAIEIAEQHDLDEMA